jgi:tetratricopeptide (TPR) repeat protein
MSIPTSNTPAPASFSPAPSAPVSDRSKPPDRRPPRLRYVFGIPLLLILGGIAITQAPREVGRWKLAAALDLRAEGKKDAAYAQLEEAMRWFPENPLLLLQRADWKLEDGDKEEALADAEKMLAKAGNSYTWLLVHSHFLQTAGEFERAVEDWKRIDRESRRTGTPDRVRALNGLAYARALANIEIEEGLENVNEALERDARENPDDQLGKAALLDTRAYLLYLKGGSSSLTIALKDMNEAVESMRQMAVGVQTLPKTGKSKMDRLRLLQSYPKSWREATLNAESDPVTKFESARRTVAVMHYHRALIFEALGRKDGAEVDREAARKLIGREPDETLF